MGGGGTKLGTSSYTCASIYDVKMSRDKGGILLNSVEDCCVYAIIETNKYVSGCGCKAKFRSFFFGFEV